MLTNYTNRTIRTIRAKMNGMPQNAREGAPPLFSTKEAARYLGLSPHTLRRWQDEEGLNGLPYLLVQDVPRIARYRVEDLDAWVELRMRRPPRTGGSTR